MNKKKRAMELLKKPICRICERQLVIRIIVHFNRRFLLFLSYCSSCQDMEVYIEENNVKTSELDKFMNLIDPFKHDYTIAHPKKDAIPKKIRNNFIIYGVKLDSFIYSNDITDY